LKGEPKVKRVKCEKPNAPLSKKKIACRVFSLSAVAPRYSWGVTGHLPWTPITFQMLL